MADEGGFGASFSGIGDAIGNFFGGGASKPPASGGMGTDELPANAEATEGRGLFGSGVSGFGPPRYETKPEADPLDTAANLLQQRIKRAEQVGSNPILSVINPEGAMAARNFVQQGAEQLLKIKQQQATIKGGKEQAQMLGLAPGDVPDEATNEQRVQFAQQKALTGDLRVFKGLQAADPKAAEAIAPQVFAASADHLDKAQYAFDKLSNMRNQGEYIAAVRSLEKDGSLPALQAIGLKVPQSYGEFSAVKGREGQALREARIAINDTRTRLEERNTYQPMEEKEAKTYNGRFTTAYGDQITNGTWSRNAAAGTRGLVINGASDPRELGKTFTLATPEQREAIRKEFEGAVPKEELAKFRADERIYQIAIKDDKGNTLPEGKINTNPNVQQGIAEGLASILRGGSGGANQGLLRIEMEKRGWSQQAIDGFISNYAGALNTMFKDAQKPYLSENTQRQIRSVMDAIHAANTSSINERTEHIAKRAGALGLDNAVFGLRKDEATSIDTALKAGRDEQIARMLPFHQAIGSGDGVFQLGAQRPGAGAAGIPGGTSPATQLPGAPAVRTPVQAASSPPNAPVPGGGGNPPAPSPSNPSAAGPGGAPPQAYNVAGQNVNVALPPGASPNYVNAMQRIESGGQRDPWKATTGASSASGAFQFINSTWKANKPPGAPDRAADATPQQQAEALGTLTAKNAAALSRSGLQVDDTNLYITHNLGEGAGPKLLKAPLTADARSIVGEQAAANNPKFFKGRPTVATVLSRYQAEMAKDIDTSVPRTAPGTPAAPAGDKPGLMQRIGRALMAGVPEAEKPAAEQRTAETAATVAPPVLSTIGAIGGGVAGGPAGAVAGGAAGGAAGQMAQDYLRGKDQNPAAIAKEAALGGVLSVGSVARPVVSAAARAVGAGGVEGGAAALEGKDGADAVDAGVKGVALAAGGEAFGRALGMIGHKVWNMFAPDAKQAVMTAAQKYADADKVLASEPNRLPGVNGAAGGPNPKYIQAEQAKGEAETVLKDAGLKPEEAAYAARAVADQVPKQEAMAGRPGGLEKQEIGAGYQQLKAEVDSRGVGAPKAAPKLTDGPLAAVENKNVSAKHKELAERVEMAITAPAPDWKTKWQQLMDARSDLLELERDALSSTATGKSLEAKDMRKLADTVRAQQEKAAEYVFGKQDGKAFMDRLRVLDVRYRRLNEVTNGGDLAAAAAWKGEKGREADKAFRAFAMDDREALAAWTAMRKAANSGNALEKGVHDLVAAERIPVLGKVFSAAKLLGRLSAWRAERAAGSPVTFKDLLNMPDDAVTARMTRDVLGTAAQRGAVMGGNQ